MENQEIKIPKRLFFIWFGNQCPKYVEFCIQNFKRKNPLFEIVFLRKTTKEIEDIWFKNEINNKYDSLIRKCQEEIIFETGIYSDYIRNQKYNLYKDELRFIQILSDVVRVELINEFGGIYLDCDTFPLKSFDDELLSYRTFCVNRHYLGYVNTDNYFMGSISRKYTNDIINPLTYSGDSILQTNKNWQSNINFWKNKLNFFKLKLNDKNIKNDSDFYIEHYNTGTWSSKKGNLIKIPYCKIDFIKKIV